MNAFVAVDHCQGAPLRAGDANLARAIIKSAAHPAGNVANWEADIIGHIAH